MGIEKQILERLGALEERVFRLERGAGTEREARPESAGRFPNRVTMDLILPETCVGGLHFNETRVHAVFDLEEDGWYHSRDILFFSARNLGNGSGKDLLTEYLSICRDSDFSSVRQQIACFLGVFIDQIEVSLPVKCEGVKEYNGCAASYWLKEPHSCPVFFNCVTIGGSDYTREGANVIGCAFMFRVDDDGKTE
jgi:hypothetical protein